MPLYVLVFLAGYGVPAYIAPFSNIQACEAAKIMVAASAMAIDKNAFGAEIDRYLCVNTSSGSAK